MTLYLCSARSNSCLSVALEQITLERPSSGVNYAQNRAEIEVEMDGGHVDQSMAVLAYLFPSHNRNLAYIS